MANPSPQDVAAFLEANYGDEAVPEPKAGASGGWDAPEAPSEARGFDLGAYLRSLSGRAVTRWGDEGRRLGALGHAGLKEQFRDMYGVGHGVNASDAAQEGRYLPAIGNAALGVADFAGPTRSKAVDTANAALRAWEAAVGMRPGQLTERAAEELMKLRPAKYKAGTKADQARIGRADAMAERAIPEPATPGGIGAQEAGRRLGIANRTGPGNLLAGTGVAAGASGIPGVVLDDIKGATIDPLNAMRREMAEERRAEKEQRSMPVTSQADAKHYWDQVDTLRHERNVHAGYAGGMGAAGVPDMYLAAKSVPWAAKRAAPWMLGMAADLAMIHPLAGLGALAVAGAPFAVPAGLTWGGWELAKGSAGQAEQAMEKHAAAGERARIVRKILENYRDRAGAPAPSLTPDQAY